MDVTLALIADAANVSAEGKLNVLGRFGVLWAGSFPARHPSMVLVLELEADPFEAGHERKIDVLLSDPDGREMSHISATVVLATQPPVPGPLQNVMIIDFRELEFQKPGPYWFKVSIDGVESQRPIEFSVRQLGQGGGQP